MQLQFDKAPLPIMKPVKREIKNVEQTQEIRINDGMPDIGRVLGAWGQVILRTKEWQQGMVCVNGGVQVNVLYVPETGEEIQKIETWIPFQTKWELPEMDTDGTACVSCLLRSTDARNTSSRKILVRANVGVCGQLWEPTELLQYTAPQLPSDVYLLKKKHSVSMPMEVGEKAFALEEEMELPETAPKLAKLLHYHLQPEISEKKIMSDKVVFRGLGQLHILYLGEDGLLHTWDFEMPFSQYGELGGDYIDGAWSDLAIAVTSLEAEPDLEGRIQLKAGFVGQYAIYQKVEIETVEDVYSPHRKTIPVMENMCFFAVEDTMQQKLEAEQTVQVQGIPVDTVFNPDHPRLQQIGGDAVMQMMGQFQVLYRDEEGQYRTTTGRWEGDCPAEGQWDAWVNLTGKPRSTTDGASMTMSAQIHAELLCCCQHHIPVVTGIETTETAEPDPDRPSLILRRAGQDSLWTLAKASGSTVAAIMEANQLETEPSPDRMLLIPVM